jgi:internalin A
LTGLEQLVMHHSDVASLPDSMTALARLRRLVWDEGRPAVRPQQLEVVWRLKSLEQLSLTCCAITQLPAAINQLTGMTKLSLHMKSLAELPDSFSLLGALEELKMEAQFMSTAGVGPQQPLQLQPVCQLGSLRRLELYSHNMSMPADIGQLTGLSWLSINGRAVDELPDSLSMLVGLESLVLCLDTPQHAVPEGITALTQLKALMVAQCLLQQAPAAVEAFVRGYELSQRRI